MTKNCVTRRRLLATGAAVPFLGAVSLAAQPRYGTPGVYVEEVPSGVHTISAAPTTRTLFIGPFGNVGTAALPTLCTSMAQFIGEFGLPDATTARSHACVELFFANGGGDALVVSTEGGAPDQLLLPLISLAAAPDVEFDLAYLTEASHTDAGDIGLAVQALHDLCIQRRALLLLDAPSDPSALPSWRGDLSISGSHAAAFSENLTSLAHPTVTIGAGGAVAGAICRTDNRRGVWKAPAGTEANLSGVAIGAAITDTVNGQLNAANVNALRQFSGPPMIWGSRLYGTTGTRRYISSQRLHLFLQKSIEPSLQWAVFEPNTSVTWDSIEMSVTAFLNGLFRDGALQGASPREAYRAVCGRGKTMTQSDIDAGRIIVEIAYAPLRPAEFEILRFTLQSAML